MSREHSTFAVKSSHTVLEVNAIRRGASEGLSSEAQEWLGGALDPECRTVDADKWHTPGKKLRISSMLNPRIQDFFNSEAMHGGSRFRVLGELEEDLAGGKDRELEGGEEREGLDCGLGRERKRGERERENKRRESEIDCHEPGNWQIVQNRHHDEDEDDCHVQGNLQLRKSQRLRCSGRSRIG